MLKVASISWSFADDIVFSNIALILYANGCRWACPGCHNRQLQCFEDIDTLKFEDNDSIIAYVKDKIDSISYLNGQMTVIGSGGDFFFQLEPWLNLCKAIKSRFPNLKILWYTGAEHTPENLALIGDDISAIDAILWGKLSVVDGFVVKKLTKATDNHLSYEITRISEYNNQFEEQLHV